MCKIQHDHLPTWAAERQGMDSLHTGFSVLNPKGRWTVAGRAMWLPCSDSQIPLEAQKVRSFPRALLTWEAFRATFLSPLTRGKDKGAVQALGRHWAWKSCWAVDLGQAYWVVATSRGPKPLIEDWMQLLIWEGLTNLSQKLMLFFLLPISSSPPHLLQDLKTAAQRFPSHLVSIFCYGLLFHLEKVSLHLRCFTLLLLCHQFIQWLHIQLTGTPSVGLPL